jgi:hypothetical protein
VKRMIQVEELDLPRYAMLDMTTSVLCMGRAILCGELWPRRQSSERNADSSVSVKM